MNRMRTGRLLPLVFAAWVTACLAPAPRAWAQDPGTGGEAALDEAAFQPVEVPVRAALSVASVPAGGEGTLAVIYDVPANAHIQVNEFFFAGMVDGGPATLGEAMRPAGDTFDEEPVFRGTTTVLYPVRFDAAAPPGAHTLRIVAGYQACSETPVFACFAPAEDTISIPVEILPAGGVAVAAHPEIFGGGAGAAKAAGEAAPAAETGLAGRLEHALANRSILAFFLVFLGGVATSFTPCVYPMIPITISYIGGRSRTRLGGFLLSVFFVLGIAITYSALGVVAATTGALFGSAMQSVPVILAVSLVFFAMGASMLGAFDIALPSGMQTRLQSGPRAGVLGALFMGAVTGIVASPCVGPVVVVLLAWVAKIGSIGLGFLLLFVFALGLGVLFLVLGTFAGALSALPQAGGWMDTVKHVFGVILLGMGLYYLRTLIGPAPTWIATGAFLLLVGTFVGAFHPVSAGAPGRDLLRKGLGILLVLAGAFIFVTGMARYVGVPLGVATGPGAARVAAGQAEAGVNWARDDVEGLALARSQGKPAFMDFYADWCAACKELDEKTWVAPEVVSESGRFVAIKLDLTAKTEWSRSRQETYRVPGLPTVIFFDSGGREVHRFFGFKPADEVLGIMRGVR